MNEETKRQSAIELFYQGGKSISEIAKELDRSRQWVYKWIKRHGSIHELWFKEESRRPKGEEPKVRIETEQAILKVRKNLMDNAFSQTGAINIQYAFRDLGQAIPPIWTINRVLKRNGLIRKASKYVSKGYEYPRHYFDTQQMDLIGPCFLGFGKRFYGVSIIKEQTHTAKTYPKNNKSAVSVAQSLIDFWKEFGLPDALQMDNELSFRGSNRHPRSLGIVLRLALSLHVVPVFIPIKEPWRNGIVERYNQTFERHVLKSVYCQSIDDLCIASSDFANFHNANHRYSSQNNHTPNQMEQLEVNRVKLDPNYALPNQIPLEEGVILFIRFIRSDQMLSILGTSFKVCKDLVYSYITAELIIHSHALVIRRDRIIYHVYDFPMPVDW
jgi:putative transposase